MEKKVNEKELRASRRQRFNSMLMDDLVVPIVFLIVPYFAVATLFEEKLIEGIMLVLSIFLIGGYVYYHGIKNNYRTLGRKSSSTYLVDAETLKIASKKQYIIREIVVYTVIMLVSSFAILEYTHTGWFLLNVILVVLLTRKNVEDYIAGTVVVDREKYELFLSEKEKVKE